MRVLIAVHGFPPTHSAGAERRAERMARWLAANGHHVEVFAIERVDASRTEVRVSPASPGAPYAVHRLSLKRSESGAAFRNSYDHQALAPALRLVLSQGRFDLVHLISGYLLGAQAITVAHEYRLPVAVTLTEFWFLCARLNLFTATGRLCTGPETAGKCVRCLSEEKRRYRLPSTMVPSITNAYWRVASVLPSIARAATAMADRQDTLRRALDEADLVISPSQYLIQTFAAFGFDTARYRFIRQGLAAPGGAGMNARPGSDGTLRVLYTGQIKIHKGVDLLIDAMVGLIESGRRATLDLWGSTTEEPDYVARLKRRTAHLASIRWRGTFSGEGAWAALADSDVAVIPSRWYENSPTVILEAFAAGRPVVATSLGGMAELVSHERNGLLFALDNADDLRRQLQRLLDEPELLPRLRRGVQPTKRLEDEMREIETEYERLLAARV